jgi:glucose-1-phosphate adenylyltransferase
LEALGSVSGFLSRRKEKYVVLTDCDGVAKMDIADIIDYHESKQADITLVTHHGKVGHRSDFMLVNSDSTGRVNEIQLSPHMSEGSQADIFINMMVINRHFLLNIVEDSVTHGFSSFESDILVKQIESLKIYEYKYQKYYAGIDSMSGYYKTNMELLKKEVRDELFGERDIYTKVRDSAPSKYGKTATVKNSLISDGCEIEGVVENSILFRGVKVGKGAIVRNSIVMQDTIIGDNASLNCVITDKNVVIGDKRSLSGCETLPYFIQKGTML